MDGHRGGGDALLLEGSGGPKPDLAPGLELLARESPGDEAELDVPDPIGQSHAAYEECLVSIEEAVEKIEGLL